MAGIEITDRTKLEKTNWVVMDLLPPTRSVTIGTPVIGGTALCKMKIRAIL